MEKFTKLGLSEELTDVLKQSGFKEPSEIQEKTIPLALAGKDIIGGSSTGSGKTLAFASAIIENLKPNKQIQAMILTPTRELAEQVATSIRKFSQNKKLNVLAIYGGVNIEYQIRKLSQADIIVGTPGRVIDHINRRTIRLNNVKFFVLDEVDKMFDMGFNRDVERIINECPKNRQTMMFSATISPEIDYLSKKYTKDPIEISVKSHIDPSKLEQVYYDVPDFKKFSLLVHLLKKEKSNLVLVFCNTRRNVDFVAENLTILGIKAKAIHGGFDQKKRLNVLSEFKKKFSDVLVCTDVAARGLDIDNVSHVYNYDVSKDPKDYTHRIGRTARAGKDGKAITILASRDYENFGTLTRAENIKITFAELPEIGMVKIKISSRKDNNRFNKGSMRKNFSRRPESDNRRRNSKRSSDRRPNSRRNSNKRNTHNKQGSRGLRSHF
jgi:ATP-dependent RNA helicase DeaD